MPMPRTACSLTLAALTLFALTLLSACAVNEAGVNYGEGILHPNHSYLENRALDLADLVTLNVGLGGGLKAEAHATRSLALGLGWAMHWDFGFSERPREYGLWETKECELTFGPFSWGNLVHASRWGVSPGEPFEGEIRGLQTSLDEIYQVERDHWAIGASATVLLFAAQVEVHPLQIVDLVTSAIGFDALADEF